MNAVGWVAAGLAGLVLLIVLAFGLEMGGLKWAMFFAPKHEAMRREVFERTRSYNESKTQDLAKLRVQYMVADSDSKAALASIIRHMFADYNTELLPVELGEFLTEVRGY